MSQPEKKEHRFGYIIFIAIGLILAVYVLIRGFNSMDSNKYAGHGFKYMHGYSSTDFTGYHVYDSEKLYRMDHEASLRIENPDDMPVLDGAEACYPVYSSLALAVYDNIAEIEKDYHDRAEKAHENDEILNGGEMFSVWTGNGRYVTFTNSSEAYYRLIRRQADMVFAARPSAQQKEDAEYRRETIMTTPIGKEAFVFFVEEDNPVDNLTSEQIRAIYHGDITNWKEVGGKDQKIVAFQRPEDSGSQVCMRYFMGDVPLADPKTYKVSSMGGVVEEIAQYANEAGAIGYSFRYFLTGLNQEKHIKIISVDGVYPDTETIRQGTYPVTVSLVCATRASEKNPYVQKMLDFILSDEGQEIIENSGYAPLSDRNVQAIAENEYDDTHDLYVSEDGRWTLKLYEQGDSAVKVFELYDSESFLKGELWTGWPDAYPENTFVADSDMYNTILDFRYDSTLDSYTLFEEENNPENLSVPALNTVFRKQN